MGMMEALLQLEFGGGASGTCNCCGGADLGGSGGGGGGGAGAGGRVRCVSWFATSSGFLRRVKARLKRKGLLGELPMREEELGAVAASSWALGETDISARRPACMLARGGENTVTYVTQTYHCYIHVL